MTDTTADVATERAIRARQRQEITDELLAFLHRELGVQLPYKPAPNADNIRRLYSTIQALDAEKDDNGRPYKITAYLPDKAHHALAERIIRATVAVLVAAACLIGLTARASAQEPVTSYATYPADVEGVPDGCAAPALEGVSFWVGSGPPAASLAIVVSPGIHAGDEVHMAWTGQTDECAGVLVSLAIKHAITPVFNPGDDQELVGWVSATASGPGALAFTLPDLTPFNGGRCNYQLDAIVGPPLAIVGPSGSFYSPLSRGDTERNMLISAANGAYDQCAPTATTTTEPTTTTTTVVDASVSPPEVNPPGASAAPDGPSTGGGEPADSTGPQQAPAAPAAAATLPATGFAAVFWGWVGTTAIALGVLALAAAHTARHRNDIAPKGWQP